MVDYTNELKKLRGMRDNLILRYGTSPTLTPSEQELRDARAIKNEIVEVWQRAIQTDCRESENELVAIEAELEKLNIRRNYKF